MACSSNSGNTYLNSLVPYPGSTGTEASYLINLSHYTCGGRRICSVEAFPVTANLNYAVQSVSNVGDGLYYANILATGSVSYKPNCANCPVSEPIYAFLSVPLTAATVPTVEAGACLCSLDGISCSCNTASKVSINAAFSVSQA